jgi:hypothetical protein
MEILGFSAATLSFEKSSLGTTVDPESPALLLFFW